MSGHSSTKVLFPGSFDPFHAGHANIVSRALDIFPMVIIAVSVNDSKHYASTLEDRVRAIQELYRDDPRVIVIANPGLTIALAHEHHVTCLIKGIRNADDLVYEQQQALWNKRHGNIDTLFFLADEEYQQLSSTKIRAND